MTFYRTGHGLFHFGRARPFGLDAAKEALSGIAKSEGGAAYLRAVLEQESTREDVDAMPDAVVVDRLAKRVAQGLLTLLPLRPKDARAEGFFLEGDASGSTKEQENKAGDTKPSPIVPAEYPVLARVESDGVIDTTLKLCAELSAQLFDAFLSEKRPSTIAAAYVALAGDESNGVSRAAGNVDVSIGIEIHPGGGLDRPKPAIPVEFVMAAKNTGERTKLSVEALARSLGDGADVSKDKPAPSVPETYVTTAEATGEGTKKTALTLGDSLAALFPNERFVRRRSAEAESA